jgi:hypothetical protein
MSGSAIRYQDQANRYIEAWKVYKYYYEMYEAEEARIRAERLSEKYRANRG